MEDACKHETPLSLLHDFYVCRSVCCQIQYPLYRWSCIQVHKGNWHQVRWRERETHMKILGRCLFFYFFLNLINKYIHLFKNKIKQCSFHIFLIGTGIDPCFRYRDSQQWHQSSSQSHKPYSLPHALCKSKKIFSRCLTLSCDNVPSN